MASNQKIVVLRFSAMGDVAMVASVLREFAVQNPQVEVIMVSRYAFKPFFDEILNLTFHTIDPKTKHKGIFGLYRLFKEIKSYHPTAVTDLHENLRSKILSTFFKLTGTKVKTIDKGRAEKRALTRDKNKVFKQLKLTVERYADVFRNLGFNIKLSHVIKANPKELPTDLVSIFKKKSNKKIGISPFAQHSFKMYPVDKMKAVIDHLNDLNYELFIFGGGEQEKEIAKYMSKDFENVHNLIGKYSLTEELAIISNLDAMLSMDSAGMHMASLMGIRTVSIWGPTHPYAGFLGYGQLQSDCIQIPHPNRPNSIYGNKPCYCGVKNCMDLIDPSTIIKKIKKL